MRLVLVVGASALAECPLALAEIDRDLQCLCQALAREGDALLVTAGTVGPEVQAELVGLTFGVRTIAYLRSGERRDGARLGRWHEQELSGSHGVSLRDRKLIERAAMASRNGFDVEVVGYLDAGARPQSSSWQRLQLARSAELRCTVQWWRRSGGFYRRVRVEAAAA